MKRAQVLAGQNGVVANGVMAQLEPEDGWWNAEEDVRDCVDRALAEGLRSESIIDIFGELISAIRGEYGE